MHVAWRIIADGNDVTGSFQDRLIAITIIDEAGSKSDSAEITLDDRDYLIELPETGAKLEIALGPAGALVDLGKWVVDELQGEIAPATLTIRARAADMASGIRAPKTRSWRDVTLEDIVKKIAGEHDLKPQASNSLKSVFYKYRAQTAESDLNFLSRLATELDAVAKPAGGYLIVAKRGDGKAVDGSDLPVITLTRSQMTGGSWEVTERGKYASVTAEWGERSTAKTQKVTVGDKKPERILRHRYENREDAKRAAEAALERSKRGSSKISIQLAGFHGDLVAGAKVDLKGIKDELTGEWITTRIQHQLTDTLTTSLEAERDNQEDKK